MTRWNPRQEKHVEWLATPRPQRDPDLKLEWAKRLGVRPSTLARWERTPGFMEAVWQRAITNVGERLPTVLMILADLAECGHTPSVRLLFDVTGHLPRGRGAQMPEEAELPESYSFDDLALATAELQSWLADLRQALHED